MDWLRVFRIRLSTDPAVLAVKQPFNDNAAAIVELQERLDNALNRIALLEQHILKDVAA